MRALLVVVTLGAHAALANDELTVEDAVKRALEVNPQLRAAREKREGAADQARAVRGQLLPSAALSEEFQHYDKEFSVVFSIPGAPTAPSFVARDQNTNTFVAGARQPLLGLLHLSQELSAAGSASDAAQAQLEAGERAVREGIEAGYLRLFEARAALQVAQASQAQLGEQLAVAEARVQAGALTTADVLRVKVAKANIRQQELQAKVQESAARTALLTALDLPLDAQVEFAEPTSLEAEAAKPVPSLPEATGQALDRRPELRAAQASAEAAEASSRARLAALLPEVDLEAAYIRIDGQAFAAKDQAYVGVKASWPVWTWGAQWYAHRAAAHQAEAARLTRDDADHQVRAEVSGRLEQLDAASSAVDVARTALESAEEAYRVTAAVVQAGSGTTTDLLDAQSALTQAKLNLVRSRY
ncbi:MAG: TolC family protein, partial [Myxococcaceae bacterium]|nr:TolC family protein [Myxococcaceae bacterium]